MAQFDVYRNPGRQREYPLLVDVQSEVVARLPSRVVVPLVLAKTYLKPITRLQPRLTIKGVEYVFRPEELAPVPASILVRPIHNLAHHRFTLIASLDLLFTGA